MPINFNQRVTIILQVGAFQGSHEGVEATDWIASHTVLSILRSLQSFTDSHTDVHSFEFFPLSLIHLLHLDSPKAPTSA